jgi:hypothetical protein
MIRREDRNNFSTQLRMPERLADALDVIATREGRSRNATINNILREAVKAEWIRSTPPEISGEKGR